MNCVKKTYQEKALIIKLSKQIPSYRDLRNFFPKLKSKSIQELRKVLLLQKFDKMNFRNELVDLSVNNIYTFDERIINIYNYLTIRDESSDFLSNSEYIEILVELCKQSREIDIAYGKIKSDYV